MLLLAAIPFGIAIGLAVGALGGGGSVLAVPVLVYVLGEDVETATTVSLVVVTAAALAGGYGHALQGTVCWRHAALFTGAALPGIVAGTVVGNAISGRAVIAGFAFVMLAAAAATWHKASAAEPAGQAGASTPAAGDPRTGRDGSWCPSLRPARDIAAGLVVGLLTGLFGVGGGFVIVPALAVALAFTIRSAIGTSLAIIVATSMLGVVVHLSAGRTLDPELTAVMAAACAAGGLAGARIGGLVPQRTLGRAFAAMVVAVSGYLLASAAFLGGLPTA
ncbi:MAG: sulfite exporter TauE/SafE family protein [Thermoleophilaceae bacterium]